MKSEIFSICDFAQDNGGKLNLSGTFNTFTTRVLPFTPGFYIAGRINFIVSEIGAIKLNINVYKDDQLLVDNLFEGNANVGNPEVGRFSMLTFALPVNIQTSQIQFKEQGEYEFKLLINGEYLASVFLNIIFKQE